MIITSWTIIINEVTFREILVILVKNYLWLLTLNRIKKAKAFLRLSYCVRFQAKYFSEVSLQQLRITVFSKETTICNETQALSTCQQSFGHLKQRLLATYFLCTHSSTTPFLLGRCIKRRLLKKGYLRK